MNLSLGTGRGAAVATAVVRGCYADYTSCLRVDVEGRVDGGWIAGQGGATKVVIMAADGRLEREVDVRSPLLVRDGTIPGPKTEEQVRWGETNSTIWGVYALPSGIAVVHARHATKDWRRGMVVQFDVFMNLYSSSGEPLVSDIRLPDLPVGHDGDIVLVVDYGLEGRRPDASAIQLIKVDVRSEIDGNLK